MMKTPFTKSTSFARKYSRLLEIVKPSDTLGILINADPDSMASAMALKRIFWKKARRVLIYRINSINRADNLAFVRFLDAGRALPGGTGTLPGRKSHWKTYWIIPKTNPALPKS
jgi:hypothetical protein